MSQLLFQVGHWAPFAPGCGYLTAFIVVRNKWRDEMIKCGVARYNWTGNGGSRRVDQRLVAPDGSGALGSRSKTPQHSLSGIILGLTRAHETLRTHHAASGRPHGRSRRALRRGGSRKPNSAAGCRSRLAVKLL